MNVDAFLELPLLGILRGIRGQDVEPVAEAAADAGVRALEVAMNTPDAERRVAELVRAARGRFAVGAGTVTDTATLERALGAGASFVVLPVLVGEVVQACRDKGVAVFPGAFTPTEVHAAWRAGATMVKLFPAAAVGPSWVRELRGPFDRIPLLVCGGVRPENVAAYMEAGATAVAVGASVFGRGRLERGDLAAVRADLQRLVEALRGWRERGAGGRARGG